jgi:hypothetical protein
MTVKQLKQRLENLPDGLEVFITQTDDEYSCSGLESVEVKPVTFVCDNPDETAVDDCLVLSDEI